MNNLDIVLTIALFIAFVVGYYKGLISQLSFGVGIVIGLLQAVLFYPTLSAKIEGATGWSEVICSVTAFIGIILAVVIVFKIAGWLISSLLKAICLQFIDRILGSLLSCTIAMLLIVGITTAGNTILPEIELFKKTTQENSLLYKHVQDFTLTIIGEVKKYK
ncbi:MAG: CvpA family protein [Bacteroidaceae bacterium]|nr:CvpA family protein [Bacteroidaceae bacterium]